ncbi:flavin-containing monooxygenase [Arthrobacter castelli]|uniref:flavin-containing monooxygenase n=1 Tax=Arthrobacter castelli TaxID=271431 RepID=UPI000405D552|nr:NAD(P)/FAD-dependent oxidoreductase [Arthrobacter castelli]
MAEKFCIVGAGAAGIGSALAFVEHGLEFDILEAGYEVGGHWNHGYDILHLITSRDTTGYPGYPMSEQYPEFPSRGQVLEYLQSVANMHQIHDRIHFGQTVEKISRTDTGHWLVRTQGRELEYAGVLIATGHLRQPRIPDIAARFTGQSIHSKDYRNTVSLAGESVLVVGSGNSGCDIAVDCAQHLLDTDIVIRSSQGFLPKSFFGVPRAELDWVNKLPGILRKPVTDLLARVTLGRNERYRGLPSHEKLPEEDDIPVINSLLLYWIQHGRADVTPGIADIRGREVEFTNGTRKTYDSIIWATGYEVTVPGIGERLRWQNGCPVTFGSSIFPAGADEEFDNLYLVGFIAPRGPQIPVYHRQASLIARAIRLRQAGQPVRRIIWDDSSTAHQIDIVRQTWDKNMLALEGLLDKQFAQHPVRADFHFGDGTDDGSDQASAHAATGAEHA